MLRKLPKAWRGTTTTTLQRKSKMGNLRPLSLTSDLGKLLEGFVAKLVLEDIKPNIDPCQHGNLRFL